MSVVSDPPRVAYVVSGDLVRYADLLPSNRGRSSVVHSLAYHLDLLDLSGLDDGGDNYKGVGSSTSSERAKLLSAIQADASSERHSNDETRKAVVVTPQAATRQQLTSYHEDSFVTQLAKGARAGNLEHPNKRRKTTGPSSRSSNCGSSHSDSKASDTSSNRQSDSDPGSDSSEELHLRPSSSVSGPSRQRGYKRARPTKNQFGLHDDCPAFQGLDRHISLVAGASITAAELLATGQTDIAIAWDGGRHHAKKNSASGFCYINDVVLAILTLRKPRKVTVTTTIPNSDQVGNQIEGDGKAKEKEKTVRRTTMKRVDRVMYLDLDLHWGDGVEEAFHTSPNVLTLSIHHYAPGFFPCYAPSSDPTRFGAPGSLKADSGVGNNTLNIPLGVGTSDASLERILSSNVQPLVDAWDPEMVVVQCGVDGLAADPMAVWNLSSNAYVQAIQRVLSWSKPTLLLGGGGYNSENAARCWSLITATCLGRFKADAAAGGHAKRHATKPNLADEPTPLVDRQQQQEQQKGTTIGEDPTPPDGKETNTSVSISDDGIALDTPIPDHKFWPNYAPEYTLNVAAGEMIDQNDESHFEAIDKVFLQHIKNLSPSNTA